MIGKIKEFIGFLTSLRGIWDTVKQSISNGMTPSGVANIIERNIDPEWADELRNNNHWNDVKSCRDFDEVRNRALGFAKESNMPIFAGKDESQIEETILNYGKSLGFLD